MPNLLALFLFPLLSASCLLCCYFFFTKILKTLAFFISLFPLLYLLLSFNQQIGTEIDYVWFPLLSIHFHLKIDALSLIFLWLTALIIPISILAVDKKEVTSPSILFSLILLLQSLLIGFFTARDLALFTIFWEGMLLPLYFIITIWGGAKCQEASLKFILYMIAGSTLMVIAVLTLYLNAANFLGTGSFNLSLLATTIPTNAYWLFVIFLLAFAVKTPLFPFHAWLPDAYTQASTTGTILLSALLSKAGIYGILRIGMELFPRQMEEWSPLLLGLSITGVFYGGLAAWSQSDFKRLLAYSSFSHVNFILVGIFAFTSLARQGALIQVFNHGITITGLFLVAGWLEQRLNSTRLETHSGLAKVLPRLCWLTLFFILSSIALPGLNNFVGELLILLGLFTLHPLLTAFLALSIILSVIYLLRWMQKVYFGSLGSYREMGRDLKATQLALVIPLIILILWIGMYPTPFLILSEAAEKLIIFRPV